MDFQLGKLKIPLYDSFAFTWGILGKKAKYIPVLTSACGGMLDLKLSRSLLDYAKTQEVPKEKIKTLERNLAHKTYTTEAIRLGARATFSTFLGYSTRKLCGKLVHKSL